MLPKFSIYSTSAVLGICWSSVIGSYTFLKIWSYRLLFSCWSGLFSLWLPWDGLGFATVFLGKCLDMAEGDSLQSGCHSDKPTVSKQGTINSWSSRSIKVLLYICKWPLKRKQSVLHDEWDHANRTEMYFLQCRHVDSDELWLVVSSFQRRRIVRQSSRWKSLRPALKTKHSYGTNSLTHWLPIRSCYVHQTGTFTVWGNSTLPLYLASQIN